MLGSYLLIGETKKGFHVLLEIDAKLLEVEKAIGMPVGDLGAVSEIREHLCW